MGRNSAPISQKGFWNSAWNAATTGLFGITQPRLARGIRETAFSGGWNTYQHGRQAFRKWFHGYNKLRVKLNKYGKKYSIGHASGYNRRKKRWHFAGARR